MTRKRANQAESYTSRRVKRGSEAAGSGAPGLPPPADDVVHTYDALLPAVLTARYKRFLGDVTFPGEASAAVVHVPNTGPMTGLVDSLPAAALLSRSDNPSRKYAHTLEWMQPAAGDSWVGVHSAKANAMVARLLALRAFPQLLPYTSVKAEVRYGAEKSRVDFVLEREEEGAVASTCYTEVKSVTLAEVAEDVSYSDSLRLRRCTWTAAEPAVFRCTRVCRASWRRCSRTPSACAGSATCGS
jgi:sugar fermentation stimulation protein